MSNLNIQTTTTDNSVSGSQNTPSFMSSKNINFTMVHILCELAIVGGIAYFFNKKIIELQHKVADLEKKLNESNKGGDSSFDMVKFQKETTHHINSLYIAIRNLSSTVCKLDMGSNEVKYSNHQEENVLRQRKIKREETIPTIEVKDTESIVINEEDLDRQLLDEYRELELQSDDSSSLEEKNDSLSFEKDEELSSEKDEEKDDDNNGKREIKIEVIESEKPLEFITPVVKKKNTKKSK